MADNDTSDASRAPRPRGVRARLVSGLGQSLGGNATAFGYSVTITASFGAVELGRGAPRFGDLIVFGLGAAYGVGSGLYYAVDWALACDTLPAPERAAKDMGLFHVAFTLPQVLVPAVAGPVLDYFNRQHANSGYRVIFSAAVVFMIVGSYFVSRIKSVR